MKILSKTVQFFQEVRQELSKVSWSSRHEVIASTILVVVMTVIMSVFIGITDLLLSKGLSVLFK